MSGFDEAFDWVVVGSGAGSMSSALVMRQAGKSVVILEKTQYVGGTTAKSGGVMWIPNNRFIKAAEPDESPEKAITYLDTLCGDSPDTPGTNHEKRLAYVNEAPKMLEFIIDQGIDMERAAEYWPDYYDDLPGGCKTTRCVTAKYFNLKELGPWEKKIAPGFAPFPVKLDDGMKTGFRNKSKELAKLYRQIVMRTIIGKLTFKNFTSAGAALQGRMLKAALAAGVVVRIDSGVSELVIDDGKVTGVVTSGGRRIGANLGVLVNAGGFAQNQAMRDKYQPGTQAAWSNTPPGDTGDMHREMERIGGVLAQMDQMVGYQTIRTPGFDADFVKPSGQSMTGRPGAILVDQSGVRYLNEGGSYELFCQTMLERNRTVAAVPSWALFDQRYAEDYLVAGEWVGKARTPAGWVEQGYLIKAETIEGLAAQIKVDPAILRSTIERWNSFVDKGVDDDFGRGAREYDKWLGDPFHGPNPSLGRLDKAPFFAVQMIPGDVSTYGGALIDASARVLNADGAPIPGLYACGVSTASIMGGVYPGAGASVGPSMTFGYIAAKHAAGVGNQV